MASVVFSISGDGKVLWESGEMKAGDSARLDEFTLSLLANDEVIEVDQDPLGKPGYRVSITG